MSIITEIKAIKTDKKELKKFGLRGGLVLAILGALCVWRDVHAYWFFLPLSAYNLIGALMCPKILVPIHKIVFAIVMCLGFIVTTVVMLCAFYLIFAPVGLIGRLCGKSFFDEKNDKESESYWIQRENKEFDPVKYERQF